MPIGRTPLFRQVMRALLRARWDGLTPAERERIEQRHSAREAVGHSRREFVRLLGAAGVASAAGGLLSAGRVSAQDDPTKKEAPEAADKKIVPIYSGGPVAILGGGVSGLTAAYRLMQANVPCELFEASERFGGRIHTQPNFNAEGMFCELGGELVDSNHADLIALAGELGLEIQELKGTDNGKDLYHFNGKILTDADVIPAFRPFADRLLKDAEGLTDADEEYTDKAKKLDKIPLSDYLASRSTGIERWVINLLRVAYTGEYGRDVADQSALNLITYLDPDTTKGFFIFGDSDESKRVAGGSSSLTNALFNAIEGKVKVNPAHRLKNIGRTGDQFQFAFETPEGTRKAKFERAICTLPFTILRELDGIKELGLSADKQRSIQNLGYGLNAKVMYGFTTRWWRDPSLKLPEPSNGSVFTELPFQCIWESSRGQGGNSGILTNFIGGSAGKQFTVDRFEKFQDELDKVFPGIKSKFDQKRAMMNWPAYRHTKGSYTCPLVGQYTTLLAAAPLPELDGKLLFAGEHTSGDYSGYMNGAVESGNRVAKELLTPPEQQETEPKAQKKSAA